MRHPRRDELRERLGAQEIGTGIHYPTPVHLHEAYAGSGWSSGQFPEAERAAAQVFKHERLLRATARVLRLLQRPLVHNGKLRLPAALNPAKERHLPVLAKKSFREMWEQGEVQ